MMMMMVILGLKHCTGGGGLVVANRAVAVEIRSPYQHYTVIHN